MSDKYKKCYVLTVSRFFPVNHPRSGEPTGFVEAIENNTKIHTIRGNLERWYDIKDELQDGKAYLSLRYWTGKPYRSKQKEFKRLYKIGVQPVFITYYSFLEVTRNTQYIYYSDIEITAKNDGLSYEDFDNWFFPPKSKLDEFSGAIIHFTDFRY